ncbi:hypothetical protein VUR80DRAFT_7286 [Thermomyces stellatus]
MASVKDSFLDLERHVRQLEANVKELKSSLEHWRTWDAEYEALKEEVVAAQQDGVRESAELSRVRNGFEGDLVKGKEITDIFGGDKQRSASQVIGILDRRLDYVGTNVRTLEKKLAEAERKLETARVVSDPGATDEEGLPITEIFEKLDEEGNVISHELWTPGSKKPQMEELLGKVGAANGEVREAEAEKVRSSESPNESKIKPKTPQQAPKESPPLPGVKPAAPVPQEDLSRGSEDEKAITKVEADEPPESSEKPEMSKAAQRVQRIMDKAREQEELSKSQPVIPEDESEEDAALRQQMLHYGMSHSAGGMGEVVAVMNDLRFEDSGDDDEFNSFSDIDESEEEDDDDSEEDQWGRSTKRVITERYQQRMLELEQRLGVQSRFTRKLAENAKADEHEDEGYTEGIGRITVKDTENLSKASPKSSARDAEPPASGVLKSDGALKQKKSVRFAGSLDIAPDEVVKPEAEPQKPAPKRSETANPVADLIVEQTGPQKAEPPSVPETKTRKPSRFKQMKGGASVPDATRKPTQEAKERKPTEGSGIMEDLCWTETVPEKDVDGDVDNEITKREIADEYQRRRRRMIEKQGGFLKEDQSEIQDEGRPMSRFRAARLSRE